MNIWIVLPILAIAAAAPLQAAEPEQPKIDLQKCGRAIGGLRSCMIPGGEYIFMTDEVYQELVQKYHITPDQ